MSSRAAATLALGVLAGALATVPAAPVVAAEEQAACDVTAVPGTEPFAPSEARTSQPLARMGVPAAHRVTRGAGQTVAVVDSGVQRGVGIDVAADRSLLANSAGPALLSGHGTIVAGLIAGPEGAAPDATVIDAKVYDTATPDVEEGQVGVSSGGIAEGIRALISRHRAEPFGVVNISLSVSAHDPRLAAAVRDLVALDVVVVASAGNADPDRAGEGFDGTPGSDATVYPADYPGVVAVSAVPPGDEHPKSFVLPNDETVVAAPTYGGISVNANATGPGGRCDVQQVATSWAAAEVSGVAALLRARYPKESARQIIARLVATAEGSGGDNPWTGAGVVQAHDALTRELAPTRAGKVAGTRAEVSDDAQAPPTPQQVDLFGPARARLLWFGLLAGGLMALAFVLRPLLRR